MRRADEIRDRQIAAAIAAFACAVRKTGHQALGHETHAPNGARPTWAHASTAYLCRTTPLIPATVLIAACPSWGRAASLKRWRTEAQREHAEPNKQAGRKKKMEPRGRREEGIDWRAFKRDSHHCATAMARPVLAALSRLLAWGC